MWYARPPYLASLFTFDPPDACENSLPVDPWCRGVHGRCVTYDRKLGDHWQPPESIPSIWTKGQREGNGIVKTTNDQGSLSVVLLWLPWVSQLHMLWSITWTERKSHPTLPFPLSLFLPISKLQVQSAGSKYVYQEVKYKQLNLFCVNCFPENKIQMQHKL